MQGYEEVFLFRSKVSGTLLALVLAGCTGFGMKSRDPTPVNSTAVLETHVVGEANGELFPAFESVTLSYTRANMQRLEYSVWDGNGITRRLRPADTVTRIDRLDGKVAWILDAGNRQYSECALKGCPTPAPKKVPAKQPADDKSRDAQCRLKIGTTTFTVEPTGKKRSINGFDSDQYDVKWQVTFRDNAAHKSTSTFSIDLWTTPVTPALKDAAALEKAYARMRDKILDTETDMDATIALPREAARLIGGYLYESVSPADRASFLASRKLDKVKGQPIQMTVKWSLAGEACSMDETMKDNGDKPLLTFMSEVKSHKVETLHDSMFAPPKDYKRKK